MATRTWPNTTRTGPLGRPEGFQRSVREVEANERKGRPTDLGEALWAGTLDVAVRKEAVILLAVELLVLVLLEPAILVELEEDALADPGEFRWCQFLDGRFTVWPRTRSAAESRFGQSGRSRSGTTRTLPRGACGLWKWHGQLPTLPHPELEARTHTCRTAPGVQHFPSQP